MSLRVEAVVRVARDLPHRADLLLGRDADRAEVEASLAQDRKCLLPRRQRLVLCREIKDPFPEALADRAHGGKDAAHGLADAGRGHEEELLPFPDGMIDRGGQLFLAFAIRKRKLQMLHGEIPFGFVADLPLREAVPFSKQVPVPLFKLLSAVPLGEIADLLGVQRDVGHADADLHQPARIGANGGIAFCLREMNSFRRFKAGDVHIHALDFVDDSEAVIFRVHAVRPALDAHGHLVKDRVPAEKHFALITVLLALLDLAVHLRAEERRLRIKALPPCVEIAAAKDEFHERAHGNTREHLSCARARSICFFPA